MAFRFRFRSLERKRYCVDIVTISITKLPIELYSEINNIKEEIDITRRIMLF